VSAVPALRHPARARPVAELSLEELLARPEELARRWAAVLVLECPVERIGEVPLERLAREGPALCAQVVRAVGSDAELERLLAPADGGGHEGSAPAAKLGELAGARDAGEQVRVLEALRGVLWEELLGELHWPAFDRLRPRLLADLADRLAHVCARALEVALSRVKSAAAARAPLAPVPGADDHREHTEPAARATGAVLVDERAEVSPEVWSPAVEAARRRPGALPWDVPPPAERARGAGPSAGAGAAGEEAGGDAGWQPEGGAVGDAAHDARTDANGVFDPQRAGGFSRQVPVGAVRVGPAIDHRQRQ
jgi:hypothetical protein